LTCTPRYSKNSKDNDWHLYMHYKNHAHSKNRIFNITYEEFKKNSSFGLLLLWIKTILF
jgi:hypothetical protein